MDMSKLSYYTSEEGAKFIQVLKFDKLNKDELNKDLVRTQSKRHTFGHKVKQWTFFYA